MSDDEPGVFGKLMCWLHHPGTYETDYEEDKFEDSDDLWGNPVFGGDWVEIQTKVESYESPNVVTIYEDHGNILEEIGLGSPSESFYYENLDNGEFESEMESTADLPSGKGEMKLTINPETKYPPSDDNEFALIDYWVQLEVSFDFPDGVDWMPRIFAYPLNKFLKKWFVSQLGGRMVGYDMEFAREKLMDYFDSLRKYHGEEPVQTKTLDGQYSDLEEPFFQ
ncbi:MAG: hypothetical protein ABEK00_00380 [Candidatus Nanohaloarchaea archaeon]